MCRDTARHQRSGLPATVRTARRVEMGKAVVVAPAIVVVIASISGDMFLEKFL